MTSQEDLARRCEAMLSELERAVVGKRGVIRLVLAAMLSDGHVLIEDFPGLAKTLIARSMARVAGLDFGRVQFTPDLLPSEVTGATIYDQSSREMRFRPGPVFTNLLLGDEINRAPPKTQAALLEAMAERQVTVDGTTHLLSPPFLVLATQNPVEYEGTYPLPEAQLDRFMLRVSVGYPDASEEAEVLERRAARGTETVTLSPVVTSEEFIQMQQAVEEVHVSRAVATYAADIARSTRSHPAVELGASPRGSLALMLAARAWAAMAGRDFVTPEDVKSLAIPALSHRIGLRPEHWVRGSSAADVVSSCLESVAAPSSEEVLQAG